MPSPAIPSEQIDGVYQVTFKSYGDSRGYFFESYRRSWIPGVREMVQGNCSFSRAGVLRGLHYHMRQADLWAVPTGLVRAALYDFRVSSPTRGRTQILELGDGNGIGLYIPKGVAHGFYALKDSFMTYLVDEYYDNTDELGILWNDPELKLAWGAEAPIVSARDEKNPRVSEIPAALRPR